MPFKLITFALVVFALVFSLPQARVLHMRVYART